MSDEFQMLEKRHKAVCHELHDVTAKRNELALQLDDSRAELRAAEKHVEILQGQIAEFQSYCLDKDHVIRSETQARVAAESRLGTCIEALEFAQLALNDWVTMYAEDLCDPDRVAQARSRMNQRGGLAYIGEAIGVVSDAIKGKAAVVEIPFTSGPGTGAEGYRSTDDLRTGDGMPASPDVRDSGTTPAHALEEQGIEKRSGPGSIDIDNHPWRR